MGTPAPTLKESSMKPSEKRKRMDNDNGEMELLLDKKQRSKFIKRTPVENEKDKSDIENVDTGVSVDGIISLKKSTKSTTSLAKNTEIVVSSESQVTSFDEALTQASKVKESSKISTRRGSKDKHSSKDKRTYVDKSKSTDKKSKEQTTILENVPPNLNANEKLSTTQVHERLGSSHGESKDKSVTNPDDSSDPMVCSRCKEIFSDISKYAQHSLSCNEQDPTTSEQIVDTQNVPEESPSSLPPASDSSSSSKKNNLASSDIARSNETDEAPSIDKESSNDSLIESSTKVMAEVSQVTVTNEVDNHEDVHLATDTENDDQQSVASEARVSDAEKDTETPDVGIDTPDELEVGNDGESETAVDELLSDEEETSEDIASADDMKADDVVISLREALCSSDDVDSDSSYTDEDEDTVELVFGKDNCDDCPRCQKEIQKKEENISINIVDGTYIIICGFCDVRIVLKNALSERQKQFLYCG